MLGAPGTKHSSTIDCHLSICIIPQVSLPNEPLISHGGFERKAAGTAGGYRLCTGEGNATIVISPCQQRSLIHSLSHRLSGILPGELFLRPAVATPMDLNRHTRSPM